MTDNMMENMLDTIMGIAVFTVPAILVALYFYFEHRENMARIERGHSIDGLDDGEE